MMKFERTAAAGTDQRLDALYDDIAGQLDELPLSNDCAQGGWPLAVRLTTIALLEDSAERIEAVLYVEFTEQGSDCCSGDSFACARSTHLTLHLDKRDWQASFSS